MAEPTFHSTLAFRGGSLAAALIAITVLVMGFNAYDTAQRILVQQVHQKLDLVASLQQRALLEFLAAQNDRLDLVREAAQLRSHSASGDLDTESVQRSLDALVRNDRRLIAAAVSGSDGRVLAASGAFDFARFGPPDAADASASDVSLLAIELPRLGTADGPSSVVVRGPLIGPDAQIVGSAIFAVDARPLDAVLLTEPQPNAALNGLLELHIAQHANGRVRMLRIDGEQRAQLAFPPTPRTGLAVPALPPGSTDGFAARAEVRGEALELFRPIAGSRAENGDWNGWGLVARLDRSAAYTPIVRLRRGALAGGAFLIATSLLFVAWLSRRVSVPLHVLRDAAVAVAAGDRTIRAPCERRDELGQLGRAFNEMVEQVRRSESDLEEQVADRTVELELANAELKRSNADLDDFAHVAAHDLRAPLRAVRHLADWVGEASDDLSPETQRDLALLRERVARMETLLHDLLRYARIGSGDGAEGSGGRCELVDTHGLVHDVIASLDVPEGLVIDIDAVLPKVEAPPSALRLVFQNLIENAVKHRDPNGDASRGGRITVRARPRDAHIEFSVADDGPGIALADQERIFQMFQTLRPRDEVEGSGLGLALVKKTVEHYGGSVWVDSAEGAGATFSFSWPKGLGLRRAPRPGEASGFREFDQLPETELGSTEITNMTRPTKPSSTAI